VAVSVVLVGVAGGAAAWAGVYDRQHTGRLLPDTLIDGVPVGGMTSAEAMRVLQQQVEGPLHETIHVRSGTVSLDTTAWDLGLRVDVRAAVRKAQGEVGGSLLARVWERLFSHPERLVDAKPRWQEPVLDAALAQLGDQVHVAAKNAALDASTGWLKVTPGQMGVELDVDGAKQALEDAVTLRDVGGDNIVDLPTRDVKPGVDKDAFTEAILVRAGENKLYLYRNGTIVKSWPVATGSSTYPTPTGTWQVVEKDVDPVWYNPGSAWAVGMPARIGPGPNNPLGTRALALDAPGILIHATPDTSSVGYSVSHGCIRMLPDNEQELFDQVDVGTPVVIVNAAPAPARTGATPTPTDAAQAAAVNF
jgi:lipoprotein-anchoring transpeptidase ErfK/SrfK